MLFTEWNEEMAQEHYENEIRIAREKGLKQGVEEGLEQGQLLILKQLVEGGQLTKEVAASMMNISTEELSKKFASL